MNNTKEKQQYDKNLLDLFCKTNNIVLIHNYDKINSKTIIVGKCIEPNCNENFSKSFCYLVKNNGYCNKHAIFYGNEKSRLTCIEKYGVEKPQKIDKIKEKSKQTCIKKYGIDHHLKTNFCKEKQKQTCIEKYGVENIFQNEEIKDKIKTTILNKYGVENPMQSNIIKERSKQTCIEKYGTEYSLQSNEIREKSKKTLLDKYGVENISQNDKIKKQKEQTCLENYGVINPMQCNDIKEKSKQTCLDKYGVEFVLQNEEIKDKSKNTCIKRYGVNHPMQHATIMDKNIKSSYRTKSYTLPSGTVLQYQGYENYAIDELLQSGISEQDIINGCENMPEIWYESTNGKIRKHFVDLYIPSQNKCIEVKSTWTFSDAKDSEEILNKQKAAKELGYNYEIWVYDGKGVKINCII